MNKLAITLPPFAPDYSGVCSALFELGGMQIIHDASGCTGNYTGYDEPRWYNSRSLVFCSGLRELDAVLGDDEKLIAKISLAAKELRPAFIAILGSPVPMVIGSDFTGISAEAESVTGVPSFGFSTTGLEYYDLGISAAYTTLFERFAEQPQKKQKGLINLLGATPLDFGTGKNLQLFSEELKKYGYTPRNIFGAGSSISEIAKIGEAELNLVLSYSGLKVAELLSQEFSIPYVCGQPVGVKAVEALFSEIEGSLSGTENNYFSEKKDYTRSESKPHSRILLIGEQITMLSIKKALLLDYGISECDIALPFNYSPGLEGIPVESEKALREIMNSGHYRTIIGDPLYRNLLRKPLNFVPLPHVAVSSKIYWHQETVWAGEKIIKILKGLI